MAELRRVLGVRGATVVGLGAMVGTGVFAAWTPALALAGGALLVALAIAAVVAALNATSTASLARVLPESGGAYAYGRAYLSRSAGVVAGYAFVLGKSASAGAAALTIGAYAWPGYERLVGIVAVAVALILDLRGIVKSVRVTAVLVAFVLVVLAALVVSAAVSEASSTPAAAALPAPSGAGLIAAAGILFVAFAGYARVTVLGEEVRNPARTIPRAMIASFVIIIVVYAVLAAVVLRAVSSGLVLSVAPLESIAGYVGSDALELLVRIGAVIAAGAVLLSLIAGIGRTLFAMGRGGDAPRALDQVSSGAGVPARAEISAAVLAALVVIVGGIGFALALSAALILIYYGVAHLAVLARVRRGDFPGLLGVSAALGLAGCLVVVVGLLVSTGALLEV
ncbi:MAG: amino acid permease [Actinobacteria bacterium]|nr:amino acid permease [Actinomycetota bacterium]